MKETYNADSIDIIEDLKHCRLRKGMYIGEADNPHHLFSEIHDNALDEVMNGFSKNIDIFIDTNENSYSIRDYGRGLPQDTKITPNGDEKYAIDIIFTTLNAGGKFNNENYKISSGLHGVGSTVTNALSSQLKVISFRDGQALEFRYSNGGENSEYEFYETKEKNGTLVKFIPDPEMFESDVIPIEFIKQRCEISNAFGLSTSIYINGKKEESVDNTTIYDMIKEDSDVSVYGQYNDEVFIEDESIKFSIQYTNDTGFKSNGFTNLLPNSQGGTHMWMIYKAFEEAWSRFKIPDIWTKDLYLGGRIVCAAFISEVEFSSQTKDKLTTNKKYLEKFINPIADKIYKWLKKNDELREGLIKRFQEHRASMNKLLSKKEIKDLIIINNPDKKNGNIRRKSVVSKLKECLSPSIEDSELHMCEGDSAAGPLVQMRDLKTQAILPLRGKMISASKHDLVRLLKNEEIRSLVNAAGTGIMDECDASRSRYGKYIIDTDADEDGNHITNLALSTFVNLLPDLVKQGMVYVSIPPLYGWYENGEFKTANKQEDIPEYVKHYERFKGLGQMNPNEIHYSLLNPDTRNLIKIEYPDDIDKFNEVMTSASMRYDILMDLGLIKYV